MQDRIRTIEKDLDLNNNFLVNCNCKQYDTIKFIFNMFMDGEVADLSDCIFRLQAKKGDGLPYINNNSDNISVIGNIVTIDNDNQLTARAGDTFAEVVITDKNGHMKTTFDIRLNIKSSAIDGLINSEATITILDSLEEKLNKVDNIGTVLEEANTTEKSLNNLIPTGNILKDNLDSIIGTGSTLKNDLDTVVQSSSTLKDNLDSVNTLAEHNIEELNKLGDVTDLAIQVQTNTNNISDLEADKTDILNAIGNAELQTTDKTIKGAINENKSDIGDIETLTTDDKTNLVKAVNEHEVQINNNTTSLKDLANPSLLINGDFRNPVNQRGKSSYNVNGEYTIDRWKLAYENSGTMTVNDGYISISNGVANNTFLQYNCDTDMRVLEGEKVTFTIVYKSTATYRLSSFIGSAEEDVNIYLTPIDDWTVKTLTLDLSSWKYSIGKVESSIILQSYDGSSFTNGTLDVKYIKLELGSVATPFVPRPYGEELALCKRYYEPLLHYKTFGVAMTDPTDGTILSCSLEYSPKRITPSITFGAQDAFGIPVSSGAIASKSIAVLESNIDRAQLQVRLNGSTTPGQAFSLQRNDSSNDSSVYVDAEIY